METHLNSGKINGSNKAVLTEAQFLYYPIFKEDENKLELIPVWHIYTPMSAWMENEELAEAFVVNGSIWSICDNTVSHFSCVSTLPRQAFKLKVTMLSSHIHAFPDGKISPNVIEPNSCEAIKRF